ncbi:DUF262 domain-containing protein [Nocardia sp. NPDC019219]|uniref:DUF262 domain-containing protein n=1 Tax=Nocardia sp. NPDC019219 TaxID=3154590 RepID=UPI0033C25BB6
MRTAATNRRLRMILTGVRESRLVPNPAFQRRLVWSNRNKAAFLRTVLEGMPFPEIFIAAGQVDPDTGEGTELIVDGQQRVTTLFQYFIGSPDLRLTADVPAYSDLSQDKKLAFLEYEVVVRDLGALTEDQTRELFYRINSTSYALNAMEVNNARFDGELKQFCDRLSEKQFFSSRSVFNSTDAKRMNDVRWCLTLVITLLSTYFNRDSEHESYLARYNDEFPEGNRTLVQLEKVFKYVDEIDFDTSSRVWQKTDLFTLLVELHRVIELIHQCGTSQEVGSRLESFYSKVNRIARGDSQVRDDAASEYFAATRSGANDRSSRIRRGRVINTVLLGKPFEREATLF